MHGNMTGAYDIRHVAIRNRVVLTNKMPTGLNRGFGGPQVYFALERLMQRIAVELGLDPLDVIRRNLVPAAAFPYRTAPAARCWIPATMPRPWTPRWTGGGYAELLRRRDAARAEGRLLRHRLSRRWSNPACPTWATSPPSCPSRNAGAPARRTARRRPPRSALDPLGAVTVHVASVPQGQGHRTVLAQVVADVFGLRPADIRW